MQQPKIMPARKHPSAWFSEELQGTEPLFHLALLDIYILCLGNNLFDIWQQLTFQGQPSQSWLVHMQTPAGKLIKYTFGQKDAEERMWLQLCKCIQPSEKFLSGVSGSSYYEKLAYVYHHLHVYLNHQKLPILAKINSTKLWAFLYFTKREKGDERHSFSLKYLLNNLENSSSYF